MTDDILTAAQKVIDEAASSAPAANDTAAVPPPPIPPAEPASAEPVISEFKIPADVPISDIAAIKPEEAKIPEPVVEPKPEIPVEPIPEPLAAASEKLPEASAGVVDELLTPTAAVPPPEPSMPAEPTPVVETKTETPVPPPNIPTKPKKKSSGPIIAVLLFLLAAMGVSAYFLQSTGTLADLRSRAGIKCERISDTSYCLSQIYRIVNGTCMPEQCFDTVGTALPTATTRPAATATTRPAATATGTGSSTNVCERTAGQFCVPNLAECQSADGFTRVTQSCGVVGRLCCKQTAAPTATITASSVCERTAGQFCVPNRAECQSADGFTQVSQSCRIGGYVCCKQTTTVASPTPAPFCCARTDAAIDINTCAGAATWTKTKCDSQPASCKWASNCTPTHVNTGGGGGGGGTGCSAITSYSTSMSSMQCNYYNGSQISGQGTFKGMCAFYHCPNGCTGTCGGGDPGVRLEFGPCNSGKLGANECGQIDAVDNSNRYCAPVGGCDAKIQCGSTCTKGIVVVNPTNTTAPSNQCLDIRVYNAGGTNITAGLSDGTTLLNPNDQVTVCTTKGTAAKARFRIQGITDFAENDPAVTTATEYCLGITIPTSITQAQGSFEANVFINGNWY